MKWSFRIGAIAGIDVRLHVTFLAILVLGGLAFQGAHGFVGVVFGVVLVSSLFACVTLHELGHGLAARAFGVEVREIVLLPIGGVARLAREPHRPAHELVIALAGPLVNALIAAVLALLASQTVGIQALSARVATAPSARVLLVILYWANVGLATFNMIPALPMDGGRVFRALLSMLLGRLRGTEIATSVAQVLAVVLTAYFVSQTPAGSPSQMLYVALGLFVMLTSGQERLLVRTQETLRSLRAGEVCDPNAPVFAPSETVGSVVDHLLRSPQAHYAVMHGTRLVGTLSREDAIVAAEVGLGGYVSGIMHRDILEADTETPLDELRARLLELDGAPIAIVNVEGFVGLLSLEDLARVATIASALERRGVTRASARARNSASWL